MKNLENIKFFIFDLDNTLYSGQTKVFDKIDKKMSAYISKKLNVDLISAKEIQKKYFFEYGTTLRGLQKNFAIDPYEYLKYCHDIDVSFLKKDLALREELIKIKEKKYIFTNSSNAHAQNITKQLGIQDLFDGIHDIVDADFIPKPSIEAYIKIIKKFDINPKKTLFIEDIAKNLEPAYSLGMKTVWLENKNIFAAKHSNEPYVNYKTKVLSDFLKQINMLKEN